MFFAKVVTLLVLAAMPLSMALVSHHEHAMEFSA
jgi:hypothetical protein